eukprot:gene55873-74610_t
MLFKHPHVGDGHAPIHGFAHVVNRQQGDLRCRQGFPRTDPKTVALRPINCWLTCPEFLELVGQDWDKTPEPAQSIYGPSDTRQGKWSCSFRIGYQTQTVRILGQFPIWRDPTTSEISGELCLALDTRYGRYVVRSIQISSLRTLC